MDDLLVAVRAVVALAAVLGLLLFLSRRLQKSQSAGTSPLAGLMPKKLARLADLRPVKRSPAAAGSRPRPEKITVVARSGIGGKAQLVVAEFGGIRYVLGVTEQGISVVDTQEAPLSDEDAVDREEIDDDANGAAEEPPNDIVDRALRSVA
ncbi:flagellar biosynthetic protein FliO [uncultured Microbacterium sp.]|uniref:flagellar biosynthetic protein FliO n=1 Tax=uncultured Microbacterium sp. TaxID=191216 RepID=UPI0028CFFBD4|nr:flagellar biosynthetic protein FliO [uncultured Microbacterium sp.]